jgi:hypothetical protein
MHEDGKLTPDNEDMKKLENLRGLKFLKPSQIRMIDEALLQVGEFGQVHLVVERGQLRFLVTEKSFDVFKWEPGGLDR